MSPTILVSCGETSGDLHASVLVGELLRIFPDADILALGGDRVRDAGARLLFHIKDYSILGFSGVLANLPRFIALERSLKKKLERGVDLFIPVDYPGLNLRLAAHAGKHGVPVLYYISPQVWAWGRGRIGKIERSVDFMALVLPFEESIYKGIDREFVGHPFVEDHALADPIPQAERSGVGLLPGSRVQEVQRILPVLLESAESIAKRRAGETFVVGMAPSVPESLYRDLVARSAVGVRLERDAIEIMRRSRLLLVASGSATLQAALFRTPLIIVYKVSFFNYLVARRLVTIDRIGLVNIVLGEAVVPEFVQERAVPDDIAAEALRLLEDGAARDRMIERFARLREMLTGGGGCRRVAQIAKRLLESSGPGSKTH